MCFLWLQLWLQVFSCPKKWWNLSIVAATARKYQTRETDPARKRMDIARVQGTGLRRRGTVPVRGDAELTTCYHRSN